MNTLFRRSASSRQTLPALFSPLCLPRSIAPTEAPRRPHGEPFLFGGNKLDSLRSIASTEAPRRPHGEGFLFLRNHFDSLRSGGNQWRKGFLLDGNQRREFHVDDRDQGEEGPRKGEGDEGPRKGEGEEGTRKGECEEWLEISKLGIPPEIVLELVRRGIVKQVPRGPDSSRPPNIVARMRIVASDPLFDMFYSFCLVFLGLLVGSFTQAEWLEQTETRLKEIQDECNTMKEKIDKMNINHEDSLSTGGSTGWWPWKG